MELGRGKFHFWVAGGGIYFFNSLFLKKHEKKLKKTLTNRGNDDNIRKLSPKKTALNLDN